VFNGATLKKKGSKEGDKKKKSGRAILFRTSNRLELMESEKVEGEKKRR